MSFLSFFNKRYEFMHDDAQSTIDLLSSGISKLIKKLC